MTSRSNPNDHSDRILAALRDHPRATTNEIATVTGMGRSTAARLLATLHRHGRVHRAEDSNANARQAARWSLPDPAAATVTGAVKLARGQLGALVADYLAAHPAEVVSPRQVAKDLGGRSPGAVSNALCRLVTSGQAQIVNHHPLRYQATT